MMPRYEAGQIDLTQGSTAAIGHGTLWINYVGVGDILRCASLSITIESVESISGLTLAEPWPGDSLIRSEYWIERVTPSIAPVGRLAAAVEMAKQAIDNSAGQARARYLTIAAGQEATYTAKYADACAYVADGYPESVVNYPWIAAESAATGLLPAATADRIKTLGDIWGTIKGPQIEAVRIAGKDSLASINTIPLILAHKEAVCSALDAL